MTEADVWDLSRDANLWVLLTDAVQHPLAIGRARRLATLAQRLALMATVAGCAFPYCDRSAGWCQIDHIIDVDHGGLTDLANENPLCAPHHAAKHTAGWRVWQEHQPCGTIEHHALHPTTGRHVVEHRRRWPGAP